MYPEPLALTKGLTSEQSSKKPSKLSARKYPLFLCLNTDGLQADASVTWEDDGALRGEFSMLSFGECPSVESASHLSAILEASPPQKYSLSAKACQGILNRAERRGKPLPPALKTALERQAVSLSTTKQPDLTEEAQLETMTELEMASALEVTVTRAQPSPLETGMPYFMPLENHPQDSRVKISEDGVVQTLSGKMGTGGNVPLVLQWGGLMQIEKGNSCFIMQGFGDYKAAGVASTMKANNCKEITDLVVPSQENGAFVRRLTPLECERLQGYPDGWTNIGEWIDSKGKIHKDADGPRYKALGNSIALPPWAYVLSRLSLCAACEPTMASLFDGIGGFPLIWEWLNGKGTCLWASEIEEFPIAVTKLHFPEEEQHEKS